MWQGSRPSPGADVDRGEPSPGAHVGGGRASVPVQMWEGVSPVLVPMWHSQREGEAAQSTCASHTGACAPLLRSSPVAVRATVPVAVPSAQPRARAALVRQRCALAVGGTGSSAVRLCVRVGLSDAVRTVCFGLQAWARRSGDVSCGAWTCSRASASQRTHNHDKGTDDRDEGYG
jgi:hypothetical protein